MRCDVRLKNGTVIDPDTRTSVQRDVCIHDGFIVDAATADSAIWEFDATDLLIMPGLVDFHVHAYKQGSDEAFPPDCLTAHGVTSAVDAGTGGAVTIGGFMAMADLATVRLRAFLDVWPSGMAMHQSVDPAQWEPGLVRQVFQRYGDRLLGLKLRLGKPFLRQHDLRSLDATIALAQELGVPAAVHCTDAPDSLTAICERLRPGDLLVHCFEGTGNTILGSDGTILPEVKAARARGVLMDACNGRLNWTFNVAEQAMTEGFLPDIISSDLTRFSMYKDPVWGLPYVMSKYLMLGMDLMDIVTAATSTPARLMGMADTIGTLKPGACGDVAVFRLDKRAVRFSDSHRKTRVGQELLVPQLTVLDGRLVYRSMDTLDRTA